MIRSIDLAALAVGVLQLADMATTLMAMGRGAREANPLVAACMRLLGRVGGLALAKLAGLGLTLWLWWQGSGFLLWAVALLYLWVVMHNLRVWRRRRRRARAARRPGATSLP
ncbi:DUF5658 family protein [Acidimangrovimonas sediminis]|uniref:DUF5658 family protein n=1 Tax=Acidimangrovimonas sediminis TaxID=2056283 RepID=UPI000C80C664|nr:DUF5658 family protein [Acidimangrovimonas sediminis]